PLLDLHAVLPLVVGDGGPDRVLGEDGAVDLHGRKAQLLDDLGVLDLESLVEGAALEPLGGQGRGGDRAAAPEALEPGVLDDAGLLVDLDLELHHIAALRRADEADPDVLAGLDLLAGAEVADVARPLVMVDDLLGIRHGGPRGCWFVERRTGRQWACHSILVMSIPSLCRSYSGESSRSFSTARTIASAV